MLTRFTRSDLQPIISTFVFPFNISFHTWPFSTEHHGLELLFYKSKHKLCGCNPNGDFHEFPRGAYHIMYFRGAVAG